MPGRTLDHRVAGGGLGRGGAGDTHHARAGHPGGDRAGPPEQTPTADAVLLLLRF
ncbi:hypothetical protein ABT214_23760 [Micromonospora purpureochromogenes]|uniref:hypothetical protein n=1 Tax=Micromonospora purpureochromogenes TaxID=47872 RepID=UPI00332A0AF9